MLLSDVTFLTLRRSKIAAMHVTANHTAGNPMSGHHHRSWMGAARAISTGVSRTCRKRKAGYAVDVGWSFRDVLLLRSVPLHFPLTSPAGGSSSSAPTVTLEVPAALSRGEQQRCYPEEERGRLPCGDVHLVVLSQKRACRLQAVRTGQSFVDSIIEATSKRASGSGR